MEMQTLLLQVPDLCAMTFLACSSAGRWWCEHCYCWTVSGI